jgi:hypothetical protein
MFCVLNIHFLKNKHIILNIKVLIAELDIDLDIVETQFNNILIFIHNTVKRIADQYFIRKQDQTTLSC